MLDPTKDTEIDNDGNTLVLKNVSDSGTYWVVVSDGKYNATSNKVTVNIVKAEALLLSACLVDLWRNG